ncbi:hypothetical protein JYK02_11295 [Corallococcus macrosporus]|uniref:Type I restriction enzyme R protein N-terminal domain-containing protein n=1 Tax=Corallococcus macrosporus TaxID=35 RepID=A0ABS3DBP9_9BACT|nr:hypothetical protein [Corallococcus macrosporus]MBN8228092.1 hypothetical protein [Corallococcus macrosporus]
MNADIVLRSPSGKVIAVVEAKGSMKLTPTLAMQLRRRMLAHGLPATVPYFLLLTQERGFLWKGTATSHPDALPDAEFPMSKVVERYLPAGPGARLHGTQLELLLVQWLTELALKAAPSRSGTETKLKKLGFLDAIRGAQVMHEVALDPFGAPA